MSTARTVAGSSQNYSDVSGGSTSDVSRVAIQGLRWYLTIRRLPISHPSSFLTIVRSTPGEREIHMQQNVPQPQQSNAARQEYVIDHDFDGPARFTTTVCHAISDVSGADLTDVHYHLPLYVDMDALDRLFAPTPKESPIDRINHCSISMFILGCHVTAYSNGRVIVTPSN